jgi:signal peptidase I
VPLENIVGKAKMIFFSTNGYAMLPEVWKWPWSIRYNRVLEPIRPIHDATSDK